MLAQIIPGRKCVCSIETNTKRKFGAEFHDLFQVLKAMTDALALSGSIFRSMRSFPGTKPLLAIFKLSLHVRMPSASQAPLALPG